MQAFGRQSLRAPDRAPIHYERHWPEQTTPYRLVRERAATFLAEPGKWVVEFRIL